MDMDNLKNTLDKKVQEIRQRQEKNKDTLYRYLWVSVNFAVVKDSHIKQIGARAFGVFVVIRVFMGKDNIAYPSLEGIAKLSGCGVSTVQKEINILIKNGWLRKVGRIREDNGKFGKTKYLILEKDLIRGTGQQGFTRQPLVQSNDGD